MHWLIVILRLIIIIVLFFLFIILNVPERPFLALGLYFILLFSIYIIHIFDMHLYETEERQRYAAEKEALRKESIRREEKMRDKENLMEELDAKLSSEELTVGQIDYFIRNSILTSSQKEALKQKYLNKYICTVCGGIVEPQWKECVYCKHSIDLDPNE